LITWRTLLATSVALGVASAAGIACAGASNCKLDQVADLPIRLERNRLLVQGTLNDQKVGVMLDTGAMKTLILRAAALRLGLRRSGAGGQLMFGVGGETAVELALVDEFRIGQAGAKKLWMLVAGEHDLGDSVTVVLGEDFFKPYDVEFDLAHNTVRLFKPEDCDDVSLAYWATADVGEVEWARRPSILGSAHFGVSRSATRRSGIPRSDSPT